MRTVDRILAVSDIHGEHDKLLKLLEKTEFNPDCDLLVVCGDLIDRGSQNLATIKTCCELRDKGAAVILKGNHEQFAQECIQDMLIERPSETLQLWVCYNGGSNTYDELVSLPQRELKTLLRFFTTLPLYFTTGDYIFVHAGADARKTLKQNDEEDMVWSDESFYHCPAYRGKTIVFGHTPTFWLTNPLNRQDKTYRKSAKVWFDPVHKDKIGIDCGSVFGGRLAALEIPSMREFYV